MPTLTLPTIIPREILFGNPEKTMPLLSPDGTRMAYLAPVNKILNIWVGEVGSKHYKPVTNDTDRGIRTYFWAEDNKHILYLQDVGGNENWLLYAVNLETGNISNFTPFEEVQIRLIKTNKHHPNQVFLGINKENPQFHDVYLLDLTSGELAQVAKNPGGFDQWLIDADFKLKGGVKYAADGSAKLLVGENEVTQWREVADWDSDNLMSSNVVGFTKDGQSIYLIDSREANAGRLVQLELNSGTITVLAEDSQYDVGSVMLHPDTYQVQAVSFNRAHQEWTVLDNSITADFEVIATLQRGDFAIVSRDSADANWLVRFNVDNGSVAYYTYNRANKAASFLFIAQSELEQYLLAEMQPIAFTSRDGLTINGYLTLPSALEPTTLPLVLFVHGGPWARDVWGYHPYAQWIANRGYVCLQVNFRGSTGYGKDFVNAGDKAWGVEMQNDLTDAVNWAIEQGYADPKKVAIMGGSYGGYAALAGATFTPAVYCCAVDIVGPSNLVTLIKSTPPYWASFLATLHKRVGNPDTEEEFLKSRSPLSKVDQIKIPMLIAQGANDPRVKQAESEQIVAAMQERGIDYEYMLFPDEGHGFAKPENNIKFIAVAEKFLAKHLGGRFEE